MTRRDGGGWGTDVEGGGFSHRSDASLNTGRPATAAAAAAAARHGGTSSAESDGRKVGSPSGPVRCPKIRTAAATCAARRPSPRSKPRTEVAGLWSSGLDHCEAADVMRARPATRDQPIGTAARRCSPARPGGAPACPGPPPRTPRAPPPTRPFRPARALVG